MRFVDPETGKSYVEKRRVRFNEPRCVARIDKDMDMLRDDNVGCPSGTVTRASHFDAWSFKYRIALRKWTSAARPWRFGTPFGVPQSVPPRRGLVARAEDWEWSSARWYARLRPVKLEMDESVLTELEMG
jgi:hypothetical protein